ncbi:MBL fold metallo-hydrolase [Actinomadura meridiana]|uniref:MBL fold metallo-hydrolase n=1 Tax=Actinomadura meridiana TaxID=559626 RepID=A0ABP8CA00_9ACTN
MAKVTFLGHAGAAVDAGAFQLLVDPWFAPAGAFLGAWHQYPRNDHLDLAGLLDADWVAVSHEHLDHFDPWVLNQLSARTRILIPHYPGPAFRERMMAAAGGRNVIELTPWEKFPLDNRGSWITAIPELSPMCHDAAFLVFADGRGFLHANDARLTAAQARRAKHLVGGRLDLMAVQTSQASWHPICYHYGPDEMTKISMDKRVSKLRAVQRLVRQTAPELAAPYAGPPCFLDAEVDHHNRTLAQEDGAFCDPEAATAWLREHLPKQSWQSFKPGDSIDLDTGAVDRDPVSAEFSFTDRDEYLKRYAADRAAAIAEALTPYPEPDSGLFDRFAAHFAYLGGLSDYFLRQIAMVVRFDVTGPNGGVWDVDFSPDGLAVSEASPDVRPHYRITTAGRWVDGVIAGRIAWEDLLLSFRVSLSRDPDVYNDYLVGLLKHANAPALQAVEVYENERDESERITVACDGVSYDIQRYCPHAGEDLSVGAIVRDGRIQCLAHNFAFDLATGECVNARAANLDARRV